MTPNNRSTNELKKVLEWWQIILLAISGIIGVTIYSTIGVVLHTASTAGTLTALAFVGGIAICVMASLGELIILWPVPGALVEYVRFFVDYDLGTVVGVAYWYTWSSIFTVLLLVAYDFFCEFLPRTEYRVIVLCFVAIVLIIINGLGVRTYGYIEAIGGIIKFLKVFAGGLFLWVCLGKLHAAPGNPSFGHNPKETSNGFFALCMSIPVLAYGFIGVEIIAVTAFEASDRNTLRWPVRWIAWIMLGMYLWVTIPATIVLPWHDKSLASLTSDSDSKDATIITRDIGVPKVNASCGQTQPFIALLAYNYGNVALGKYFNACIIYFCVSSANTALYVASRTLYGLFRVDHDEPRPWQPWWKQSIPTFRQIGTVSARGVPVAALCWSAVSWVWLIALRVFKYDVLMIMTTIGSVGGVMVWGAECAAFIRYYEWLTRYQRQLPPYYNRDARDRPWQRQRPFLTSGQPTVAWVGLVGCILIVFVLPSASFWAKAATGAEVASAFTGPVVMIVLYVVMKLRRCMFGKHAAEKSSGAEIYRTLESLSRLPLGGGPNEDSDIERPLRRRRMRQWFNQDVRNKPQVVQQVGEPIVTDANDVELPDQVHREDGSSVVRQRTWERMAENVTYSQREIQ